MTIDLSEIGTQESLAGLIGVGQSAVSRMMSEGRIPGHGTLGEQLLAYCQRLRDQAADRLGDGELDLVQERAALAREQRIAQAMKNARLRCEYAPAAALSDVLGLASSAIVDRIDQLDGALRKACPDLPEDARATVLQVIASARNEWIRSTARLVADEAHADTDPDEDATQALDEFDVDIEP